MKKIKENIWLIWLWIIILSVIVSKQLNNLDEMWNFNMARNIANNLVPYRDFNLVITPGLPIICGIILKIFGTEMFLMRILASFMMIAIFFMINIILKKINFSNVTADIITLFVAFLFKDYYCIDYNFCILLISLIILYCELKLYENNVFVINKKCDFLLGILAGFSILIKQTVGICVLLVFIGYKILLVRNKKDFKKFLKIVLYRFLGSIIPIIIFILYLLINSLIYDFFSYAIFGIKEFTNKISYVTLFSSKLMFLAIFIPLAIILSGLIGVYKANNKLIILFSYSLSTLVIVYPISDEIHFLISMTIGIITEFYLLKLLLDEYVKEKIKCKFNKKVLVYIKCLLESIVSVSLIMLACIKGYDIYNLKLFQYANLNNFKYIPVSQEAIDCINNIDEYILQSGQNTYILDARAALYMIPIDRYNKNYDMFLIGNMGKNGDNSIINDIKNKDDIKLLIVKDESIMNWQTPKNVIKYVKENFEICDEIEYFDVYKKKEM